MRISEAKATTQHVVTIFGGKIKNVC